MYLKLGVNVVLRLCEYIMRKEHLNSVQVIAMLWIRLLRKGLWHHRCAPWIVFWLWNDNQNRVFRLLFKLITSMMTANVRIMDKAPFNWNNFILSHPKFLPIANTLNFYLLRPQIYLCIYYILQTHVAFWGSQTRNCCALPWAEDCIQLNYTTYSRDNSPRCLIQMFIRLYVVQVLVA